MPYKDAKNIQKKIYNVKPFSGYIIINILQKAGQMNVVIINSP